MKRTEESSKLMTHALPQHSVTTRNVIHCMDALQFLRALPAASVDCIITDPPYGLAGRVFNFPHKLYSAVNETWDHHVPITWMAECARLLKPGGSVLCFGVRQSIYKLAAEGLRLGWRLVNDITWHKPNAAPCFTGRLLTESTERILWFCPDRKNWTYNLDFAKAINGGNNLHDVWSQGALRGPRIHPTQKPVALVDCIVRLFTQPGALILDPFMGSGTTAVAARAANRDFIGCDSSAEYVALARARLQNKDPFAAKMLPTGAVQLSLFEAS